MQVMIAMTSAGETVGQGRGQMKRQNSDFARVLKALLERYSVSANMLAAKAGLSQGLLSKYGSGERVPKEDNVHRLADALGLTDTERNSLLAAAGRVGVEDVVVTHKITGVESDRMAQAINQVLVAAMPAQVRIPILKDKIEVTHLMTNQNFEEWITVPRAWVPRGEEAKCYAVRVRGNSMEGADIRDGDILAVRQVDAADAGQIVVAILGEDVTVKRLGFIAGRPYLFSDPQRLMEPIPLEEGRIIGVPISLQRRVQ